MRMRRAVMLVAILLAVAAGAIGLVVVRVRHTLDRAAVNVRQRGEWAFTMRTLGHPENAGFEAIVSPAEFADAAFFKGQLYVSGPAGLYAYDAEGRLRKSWRVGMGLPPSPLGRIVVGRLRGASDRS